MKRKLFVALIAVVVISAIVGSCFAAYAKSAVKTITLSTGDAVTLDLTRQNGQNALAETGWQPGDSADYAVTLTCSDDGSKTAGMSGLFTVVIEPADDTNDADVALASALDVKVGETYDKAALTAGQDIVLSTTPVNLTLTFSIPSNISDSAFAALALGEVSITLKWEIIDNWSADPNTYYIVGTMTGWDINRDCITLSTAAADLGQSGNSAVLRNVHFEKGDQFKVVKGDTWYPLLGGASVTAGDLTIKVAEDESNGNAIVNVAGDYCIYQNGEGFYVGPYPEN